ncbi:protein-tyrosine phosphatase family protein [Alteromonas arenosi]|nr:tyrosine-protein phosphatase [Alteromonas sp. ASW11-36]
MDENSLKLGQKITALLNQTSLYQFEEEIAALIQETQQWLATNPASKRELGLPLSELRKAQQAIAANPIHWVKVLDGRLAIGPRPKEKVVQRMHWYGVTHIFTLQAQSEKAEVIGSMAQARGLDWLWFPMASAVPPEEARENELRRLFETAQSVLQRGGGIYLHCAAGIHRTGMMAYALLRFIGQSHDKAMATLGECRTETFEGVGAERIAWAERFGRG